MSYATTPLVRQWMPTITSTVVSDATVLDFISATESLAINPILAPMYSIPFATPSTYIRNLSAKVTALEILETEYQGGNINAKPDYIGTLRSDVNAEFLKIRLGQVRLDDE